MYTVSDAITLAALGTVTVIGVPVLGLWMQAAKQRKDEKDSAREHVDKEVTTLESKIGVAHDRINTLENERAATSYALGRMDGRLEVLQALVLAAKH